MKNLSDKMLQVALAVLAECAWRITKSTKEPFERLFAQALEEMQRRGLPRVEVESDLVPRLSRFAGSAQYEEEGKLLWDDMVSFDPSVFDDEELAVMYAIGAEIADFSMLGRGIRTLNEAIWNKSYDEMNKRKLECKFLCDYEYGDK